MLSILYKNLFSLDGRLCFGRSYGTGAIMVPFAEMKEIMLSLISSKDKADASNQKYFLSFQSCV
jgi:hypothetical protein